MGVLFFVVVAMPLGCGGLFVVTGQATWALDESWAIICVVLAVVLGTAWYVLYR